jgi:iron complex outermembrane receptor protein
MRRSILAASVQSAWVLGLLVYGPAAAQPAAETAKAENADVVTLDTVQVAGIRSSLAKSVSDKRDADIISDSIAAEDIGKFPQQNMAESLQRVTGVQITRSRGEGRAVSVRGLDPKFTQVLYNGRQLPSASGDRSFDFTILSADFVNALSVYKTPVPEMRDGGMSATINVQTAKPLDIGERHGAIAAEGIHDPGGTTPHLSAFYTDTFADNTFGVSLGVDYSKRQLQGQRYEAFGFEQRSEASSGFDLNADGDLDDTLRFNHAANFGIDQGTRERESVMAAFQYRPNDVFELRSDVLHSKFTTDALYPVNAHRFTYIIGTQGTSASDDGSGYLDYFESDGVDLRNNARTENVVDELKSISIGSSYVNDRWTTDAEVSYGKSRRVQSNLSLEVIGRANVSYDYRTDHGGIPSLEYHGGFDPSAPGVFRAIGFNGKVDQPTEDTTRDARLDFTYAMDGAIKSIRFGAAAGSREYLIDSRFLQVGAEDLAELLGVAYDPVLEGGSFDGTPWMRRFGGSGYLSGYDGSSTFPTGWLSADPYALLRDIPLSELERLFPPVRFQTSVSDVKEGTRALYFRADFGTEDGRLTGNAGLRYVRTEQETLGYIPDLTRIVFEQGSAITIVPDAVAQTISRSYDNVLPSLNLRYELRGDLVARFAAARVMSRPDLNVISPTTSVSANVKTISSGNPNVDPYLADQFDISLEWYFNNESMLSAAFFYKNVENFIVNTTNVEVLNVRQGANGPSLPVEFTRFQPGNGGDTRIKGIEFAYQQPFTFLPPPFDGFGMMANYTYIDAGELPTEEGGAGKTLPGVSRSSYNVTVYYEKPRFGAYLSYNYRDGFRLDNDSYFGDGSRIDEYGQLDLSIDFKFTPHLGMTLAANNLTDEPVVAVNDAGYGRGYESTGRRIMLGLRYDF